MQRHKYLRRIKELREKDHRVFYQDETWCNANHTREFVWQMEDEEKSLISDSQRKGGLKVPSGSGKRPIINNIGSSDGFLKDCGECFIGKKDTSDYHHEMNGPHFFEEWFEKKFCQHYRQICRCHGQRKVSLSNDGREKTTHNKFEKSGNPGLAH